MINFLTGRQTDPLQEIILDRAVQHYQQNPDKLTFIIVPNHIKFTTEVKAISKLAKLENASSVAVKNLQVLSFSRLAWYFLKDQEKGMQTQLDDAAAAMLLSRIIRKHHDEFLLFKYVNVNSGLVDQIYKTILQVYEGNLDLDEIDTDALNLETRNKIHDLKIIYQAFIEEIADKFVTKNEIQLQLNDALSKANLSQSSFYFTDFSHFSLQESLTIKLLMLRAQNITLAFKTGLGNLRPNPEAGDYDYVIQQTINRLIDFASKRSLNFNIEELPLAPKQNGKELLNAFWIGATDDLSDFDQIQLVKADSRYAEAYFVARTIYQQVALNNYRFKDFLILASNLKEYETYLAPILRQNKIPFFNDLQQEMKYHPLVILIENLADMLKNNYQTANIIAILKTRLLIPDWYQNESLYLKDVDSLENFVLAHGINHNLWLKDLSSFLNNNVIRLDKYPDEVARLDQLRSYVIDKISKLIQELNQETDSKQALRIFFDFLVDCGIPKRLEQWRERDSDAGDLQQAQQPEQLWSLLMTLFQDYLLINPVEFEANGFFEMLISAFKEANFSQIPSTLDAVNISELGMVQATGYKQVFIIGVTSANLPNISKTPGFLSSENLDDLAKSFSDEAYIEDQQKINNLDQDYQFGLALALAQDRVYLTYPVLNASNEKLDPSIFYRKFAQAGALEFAQHDLPDKLNDLLYFVTSPEATLGYLAYLNSIEPSKTLDELLAISREYLPKLEENIIEASQFDNKPQNLGIDLAKELYGERLNSSVSQLETFYENSYEYFLNYGLKLRRRFENEFDVIQAGNYFHETFDRLVKYLQQRKLDLSEISELELEKSLSDIRAVMKEEGRYAQLMNDPFNRYLFDCLDKTTSDVAVSWYKRLQRTPLRPRYSELAFGFGEKIQGINLDLPDLSDKHAVNLRGKIDRVDLAPFSDSNRILAQVIDYKSSAKSFDLSMFYNGISLQMISYLDVLERNKNFFTGNNDLSLLGAFYQTVTHKLDKINSKQSIDKAFNVKKKLLDSRSKLEYTGIISNNPDNLKQAEPLLLKDGDKDKRLYSGLSVRKNGEFSITGETNFSDTEMQLLLEYDEYLIKQAAKKILSGEIEMNPFKYGNSSNALTYSDYRDVFFFDAMLRQNKYHNISKINKKDLLNQIKERLQKKDED